MPHGLTNESSGALPHVPGTKVNLQVPTGELFLQHGFANFPSVTAQRYESGFIQNIRTRAHTHTHTHKHTHTHTNARAAPVRT